MLDAGLLDEATVVPYLADRIGLDPTSARVDRLGGGVSNVVLAVRDAHQSVVFKQALPRLRVADEWTASPARAIAEAGALALAARITPGAVPSLVDADPDRCALVLRRAPARWRDWKTELLGGVVEPARAAWLGATVGEWHRATSDGGIPLPPVLAGADAFEQLRVDPYYRTAAARRPDLDHLITPYIEAMARDRRCLVHGDLSPKNVLVGERATMVIDFEVAHLGDPAFDLAFLLCHLTLKAIHLDRPARLPACAAAFTESYTRTAGPSLAPDWRYVLGHVGCLLLARVYGKSPAEYLTTTGQAKAVALGVRLLTHRPDGLEALFAAVDP